MVPCLTVHHNDDGDDTDDNQENCQNQLPATDGQRGVCGGCGLFLTDVSREHRRRVSYPTLRSPLQPHRREAIAATLVDGGYPQMAAGREAAHRLLGRAEGDTRLRGKFMCRDLAAGGFDLSDEEKKIVIMRLCHAQSPFESRSP